MPVDCPWAASPSITLAASGRWHAHAGSEGAFKGAAAQQKKAILPGSPYNLSQNLCGTGFPAGQMTG